MNDSVTILGLFSSRVDPFELGSHTRVWSLNDWYQFYAPTLVPERAFNIHFAPHICTDPKRFTGDWKAEYTKAAKLGTKIMVSEKIEGVPEDAQEEVPIYEMTKAGWPLSNMPCSISLMIQYAAFLGEKRIRLRGVYLRDSEYLGQKEGICRSIELARSRGCVVENPEEANWKKREDWAKGKDMPCGSLSHIMALYTKQFARFTLQLSRDTNGG
jgi:hypothetical protein